MRRNWTLGILIVFVVLLSALLGASAPAFENAWILLPDTAIMSEPSFTSEKLHFCNQNEQVKLLGEQKNVDGISWQKVEYNSVIVGYVPENLIYFTTQSTTENVRIVKISPEKMGDMVPLYKVIGEEKSLELPDGTNVSLLETTANFDEYAMVEYEGQNYFILKKYITDTLTHNQKVAIIIAAAIIGVVVCVVVVLMLYRKKVMNN